MFDGILIIDKPIDWTSHDVVGKTRRILQTKRVGHTGTLDPFATGVLVILVGKATRLAQFLDKDRKEYEAVVRLGFETDSGDRTGEARELKIKNYELKIEDGNLKIDDIENVLKEFRGQIEQTPPMYSAKKIGGKKLYELARQGIEVERKSVKITNYELRITNLGEAIQDSIFNIQDSKQTTHDFRPWTLDFRLRVVCSAGTYIRVLAEDIGKKLGTGAHLAELRRTGAGKFKIERAVTLDELEKIAAENKLESVLISMNEAVSHLAEVVLSDNETAKIKNGLKLAKDLPDSKNGDFLRLTADANLLAIGVYNENEKSVQPKMVF